MCVCVCVRKCVRACMRACAHACVYIHIHIVCYCYSTALDQENQNLCKRISNAHHPPAPDIPKVNHHENTQVWLFIYIT